MVVLQLLHLSVCAIVSSETQVWMKVHVFFNRTGYLSVGNGAWVVWVSQCRVVFHSDPYTNPFFFFKKIFKD